MNEVNMNERWCEARKMMAVSLPIKWVISGLPPKYCERVSFL